MLSKLILTTLIVLFPVFAGEARTIEVHKPAVVERVGIKPFSQVLDEKQIKCLTDNIYFEARGEKDIGKKAVALVTLNRLKEPEYPDTICGTVYHRTSKYHCQFSWTCMKDHKVKSVAFQF